MPDDLLGAQGTTLLTAIIIVAVALLALVGVFWLIRKRASSTFIRGGKNRQPRLAVLDATAVDTRRRLVLIRRDDVEHLVMIGGPTDIVIESRIAQHSDHGRMPQPVDQAMASPPSPQQPRMAPAARPMAPQQPRPAAPASAHSAAPSIDRPARQSDARSMSPAQPQSPLSVAATAAAAGSTATIRTEAADLLETARTRVFEEPEFDESDLDELLTAPAAQADPVMASAKPAPLQSAAPTLASTPATAVAADPIQAEAADVLENVRTRVFEEPSFDESAFDELTAVPAPGERANLVTAPTRTSTATAGSPAPASAASSDFEAVLAAELSEDLTINPVTDSLITAQYNEHQLDPDEAELLEAPAVKSEAEQPSRDSLEAEMERLLGDISRKP